MVKSGHFAALLAALCLAGCGSYAMFEPDSTAAFAPSVKPASWTKPDGQGNPIDRSDSAALTSLFARSAADTKSTSPAAPPAQPQATLQPAVMADVGPATAPLLPSPAETNTQPRGRAYLFRGVAGLIYSRGMDRLTERIQNAGIPATVDTYLVWRRVAEDVIRDYRRDPQPIALIGHSMGGDAALDIAEALNQAGIPVSLLVTYDPSRIADDVPPNVERYINIYQSSNVMGGGNVVQGARFHGHYASYNLKDHSEIIHINIEKADRIQEQLVAKVIALSQTPASGQGEAVPIRLQVPGDAPIELWDSGVPVQAHSGDTLKTLAATYRVPAWALAQINGVSERKALDDGQRIVIPRRLVPMPAPATASLDGHQPRVSGVAN